MIGIGNRFFAYFVNENLKRENNQNTSGTCGACQFSWLEFLCLRIQKSKSVQ